MTQAAIWLALNHYDYESAVFWAERLHAEVANEESIYLLATCYYRSGNKKSAHWILTQAPQFRTPQCRLLLARCCYDLGKFYEAENVLFPTSSSLTSSFSTTTYNTTNNNTTTITTTTTTTTTSSSSSSSNTTNAPNGANNLQQHLESPTSITLDNNININNNNNNNNNQHRAYTKEELESQFGSDSAAFAAQLIADIYSKTERSNEASEYFCIGRKCNPILWKSFVRLTQLSPSTNPDKLLTLASSQFTNNSNNNNISSQLQQQQQLMQLPLPPQQQNLQQSANQQQTTKQEHQQINQSTLDNTTTPNTAYNNNTTTNSTILPPPPVPNTNNQLSLIPTPTTLKSERVELSTWQQCSTPPPIRAPIRAPTRPPARPIATRRSSRLIFSVKENNKTPTKMGGINAPAKKLRRTSTSSSSSHDDLLKIIAHMGKALEYLSQYKLDQAITQLKGLPEKHFNTGWVLCCMGRAYYEKTNYQESVKYYDMAHRLEPYRLQGMEYYSSSLWHLHNEVALSKLARELREFDEMSPETWCVAGNCYSLQKEHETAIKFLERAIQVDPNFAYAYTLLGHELVNTERMDQAMTCFEIATRLDPRNYTAWYGLGCIYYKKELYAKAELHHRKALKISPTNPVLMCHIAVVQHACKQSEAAIRTLDKALQHDPKNALCKFHRATIYFATDRDDDALRELDELRQLVPNESMVYFLIGKVHKKKGNTDTALMNFSWAMDLDPKGANKTIKEVIDKHYANEEDVIVHKD